MGQFGKEDSQLVYRGAMDPLGVQRAHTDLFANPSPCFGFRVVTRATCQRVARLVRENGEIEELAKKVKIKFSISEVREGRRNRHDSQGAGGFAKQCGPILSRSMGPTLLYNLAQTARPGLPGFITHAALTEKYPPLLNSQRKTSNAQKTQTDGQRARDSGT